MSILRRRFVYNAETGQMDEVAHRPRDSGVLIMADLEDFVSPVDGKVVHGRAGLREHDRRHGTTNIADYKETWAKFQDRRAAMSEGRLNDPKRLESIVRAYNDLAEGRKKR